MARLASSKLTDVGKYPSVQSIIEKALQRVMAEWAKELVKVGVETYAEA